ncbi:hypothetical protein E2C01_058977 [Portunus trituberculatus]|uniref:Gustatory receptor n=1 Tax=Portunus trituberculatus TaxID=210409 RepID=A0A5B7H5K9_PORTR|nr:hypothetical protein [Portunus trituberculatus]
MRAKPEHQSYSVEQPGATVSLARQDSSHSALVTRGQLCDLHVLRSKEAPSNGAGNALQHMTADSEGHSFVEEFGVMFFVSSIFGIHVIRRIGHGSYCLSVPRVCASLFIICFMTGCLVVPLVALYHIKASYDLRIFLLSLFLSGITSSFIFVVWLVDSPKMMVFFAEVDKHTSVLRRPKWLPLVMAAVCLLSLLYTVAFLFITPLPDGSIHANAMKLIFLTPAFLSSVVPSLMDIYVMTCVHVVVVQLRGLRLRLRLRNAAAWTPHFTNEIANHWLRISKLLETLNEAFSFVLHLRMLLFLVEMISLLYSLVSLRWHGRCLFYFLVMAQSNFGVVFHFLAVCVIGERLLTAVSTLSFSRSAAKLTSYMI